jgi:hypothetical protein
MSGEDIPYQLRPNKFIDRQMFLELLSRLTVPRGVEKYVYVSMGGRHLIDHYAVYNQLGIQAQFSFDKNPNEVKRQKFNRPTGRTCCWEMTAAELPSKIDDILNTFPSKENLIVWLDYTDGGRRSQFQETIQTLVRLKHGDVFRVTFNANPQTLGAGEKWKESGFASPGEFRAAKLREQIEEYMPTHITTISDTELPDVLTQCMELAATAAEAQMDSLEIKPVLITSYRDSTRMLTITCAISDKNSSEMFPPREFSRWQFAGKGWKNIQRISAPVLSTREQNLLDSRLHRGKKNMLAALKFLPSEDEQKSLDALVSYRSYHRYYPSFKHVED